MKIKSLEFKNGVFLAPMAGVTDNVYRSICISMGAELVYTEMVSAKGLYYGSANTEILLKTDESQSQEKVAVQIFGNDPFIMAKACEYFEDKEEFSIIDVNMGCPVNKIVKNGEGSALMKDPILAHKIIMEMKKATSKPVTVKFRKGFDESHINAVEFGKFMEDAGADAITVHGRTREQMYTGKADWDIIKKVKEEVKTIPVIGNGDIFKAQDAIDMKECTKCDGIMVARGVQGNPFIFRDINSVLRGEEIKLATKEEKIEMCIKHLKMEVKENGEKKAIREMRKHIAFYIKGLKRCTDIKSAINSSESEEEMLKILYDYREEI